jgi:hypothetical protein
MKGFSSKFLLVEHIKNCMFCYIKTVSVVSWSEFLATDPEDPGSIPGATRFSEK